MQVSKRVGILRVEDYADLQMASSDTFIIYLSQAQQSLICV